MWAKHCYLALKETICSQYSDSLLNLAMALSLFLAEQQPSSYPSIRPDNYTTLVCDDQVFLNQSFSSSIETQTNSFSKGRLTKYLPAWTKQICERGIECNRKVKHRSLKDPSSNSLQELEYLDSLQLAKHTIKITHSCNTNPPRRMNWKSCLQMGQNQNLLEPFSTFESLLLSYSSVS